MVLEECPFCHKFFAAEQISKELVDSHEEGLIPEPGVMATRARSYNPGPPPVEFCLTYKTTYRCKDCGKEWTRTSNEEKEIARSDAGPEQASSEEVAKEAERAEEEQYARE